MNTNIMLLALGLAMDAEDAEDGADLPEGPSPHLPEGAPGVADRLQDDGRGAGGRQPGEGELLGSSGRVGWWDGGMVSYGGLLTGGRGGE